MFVGIVLFEIYKKPEDNYFLTINTELLQLSVLFNKKKKKLTCKKREKRKKK